LDGPDAARILDYIHRPAADAAVLQALHAACGDDAAFLRTVHRLPELPDVPATARAAATAPRATAISTSAPLGVAPSATAGSVPAPPADAAPPAPAPPAGPAPRLEPVSAPVETQHGLALLARLRPAQLAVIAAILLVASLVIGAMWGSRSYQSAALVGTSSPVGNGGLAVSDQPANAANQASQAPYSTPSKLVGDPVTLLPGAIQSRDANQSRAAIQSIGR